VTTVALSPFSISIEKKTKSRNQKTFHCEMESEKRAKVKVIRNGKIAREMEAQDKRPKI